MGDIRSILGAAIRDKRGDLAISQEELAERAGLHRTYISDVERGTRNPSLESIEKIARALQLSVATLFEPPGGGGVPARLIEILLVEDHEADVELTRRVFRKKGIANPLRIARDGAEAIDYLFATGAHASRGAEPLPGVVLLDLNLPKIDGLGVLRRIKGDQRTREIPVIVLTASDRDRDIAACRSLGVTTYLVKPIGLGNLSALTPHLEMEWALIKRMITRPAAAEKKPRPE